MRSDAMKSAIDGGDPAAVRALIEADPEAVHREIVWDDGCGGGSSEPIGYVSLANFHALAGHSAWGDIARVLLAAGAPVEGRPGNAESPIVTAASYDRPDVVAALIEAGADLDGHGHAAPGGTALAHAVYFGNPAVADVLVRAGARPRTPAEEAGAGTLAGRPPGASDDELAWALRAAVLCERFDVADRLLAAGVSVHAPTEDGPPLQWAAWAGKPAAVRYLVEHGADPNRRDPEFDGPPLGWCRHRRGELYWPSPGHDEVEAYLVPLTV
jgi:uncharacterized protein